jgi:hypothetical protein
MSDTVNFLYTYDSIDNMGVYGIEEFVNECVGFDIEKEVSKDELYQKYIEFRKSKGKFYAEKNIFFKEFYRLYGDRVRLVRRKVGNKRKWKVVGVYLK